MTVRTVESEKEKAETARSAWVYTHTLRLSHSSRRDGGASKDRVTNQRRAQREKEERKWKKESSWKISFNTYTMRRRSVSDYGEMGQTGWKR